MKLYKNFMVEKNVEPRKRLHDTFGWKSHRFPIKGGISWRDAMIRDMAESNFFPKDFAFGQNFTFRGIPIRFEPKAYAEACAANR